MKGFTNRKNKKETVILLLVTLDMATRGQYMKISEIPRKAFNYLIHIKDLICGCYMVSLIINLALLLE